MDDIKYGFYGRLKKDFPSQIIVDITERCNYACIHCRHKQFSKSHYYRGLNMEKEINTKLVQEIKRYGKNITQYIRYSSNGEPLLHPLAYDFISEAIRESGVPVTLTSNGSCINHERMRTLFDEGLYLIDISIDAYFPDTYKKIRVGGELIKVVENVKKMINYKNNNHLKTQIIVSYIEQPLNFNETQNFKDFWNEQGIDYIVIRSLHSNAGSLKDIATTLWSLSESKRKPCIYPWERVCLKPDGTLHFCPASWVKDDYIADFHNTSIKEVWSGEIYNSLRNAHLYSDFNKFLICEQCPDWINTKWDHEGRSYATMVGEFIKEEKK